MAEYGDLDAIKRMLDIEDSDTSWDGRITALNVVASQELADACGPGMTWGEVTSDVELTLHINTNWSIITLDVPVRAVTSITVDGVELDPDNYRLIYPEPNGLYWGIESLTSAWWGKVVITGQWAGMPTGSSEDDVPADVAEAVNVLVAGYIRRDQASEGQVTGPERFTFVPPNPWLDQRVVRVTDKYGFTSGILV